VANYVSKVLNNTFILQKVIRSIGFFSHSDQF